ncbi:MAG: FtsX-like permease family protein [Flavobacteriia bacterium]|nr:FtsX-like permease family protein [Flavobacteriia bacterium]
MAESLEKYTKRGIRNSYVSTVVGISLVLFLIGIVLSGSMALSSIQKQAKENIQCDVFFKSEVNDADIKQMENQISAWKEIKKVWFVSSERAIEEFTGDEAEDIQALFGEENPLPPSLCFNPSEAYATKNGLKKIQNKLLKTFPESIDEVSYDSASVEQINLGFKQFALVFLSVALLLIIIAVAMINNTIRMALYSRRFTIKTMQLVGATGGFIRRPFLIQSLGNGILAAAIALFLLVTVFYALNNLLETIEITFSWLNLIILSLSLLIIGVFITFVSTWFALNKYLRLKLDKLY